MSSNLLAYIDNYIKSRDGYFYYRGKYRTVSWSYKKVYDYARRFGTLLRQLYIKKGDRVIIKGQNRPEWIIAYIGCLMQGVIAVPLDVNSSDDFEKKVQNKVRAKLKVYSGNEKKSRGLISINMEDIEERLSAITPIESSDITIYPDDLTQIIFTSGTTAVPKGVKITHNNITSNLKSVKPVMDRWKKFFRLMRDLKILSVVPLSHMYGQFIGIYIPLMIGSSVVFMSNVNPKEILRAIKEERIWILGTLPKILELIKDYIVRKFNLSSKKFERKYNKFKKIKWPLRFLAFLNIHLKIGPRLVAIIVGGAAFDKNMDEFWRCIAYTIFQGYGLTETAPIITLADPAWTGAGSIGKVLEGQQIRLVDGEIYVKGDNVTPGYFKDASLTKKAFSEGWFKTGDLAEIGEDGNLYFKGRKDTVIVRDDGINIYPEDIESALKENNSVKDCVVLGLRYGSNLEIHAILLMEDEYKGGAEDIIKGANEKLNIYQHINSYIIWKDDDFPRTGTGKIKRNEVLEVLSSMEATKEDIGNKTYGKSKGILEVIGSLHKVKSKSIKKEAELEKDLGLDSLDLVQIASNIEEKYNIEVDDSLIGRDTTVGEIEKLIKSPRKASRKIPFYSFQFWFIVCLIRMIFQYIIYPFIFIILRLKIKGKENLKNLKGSIVFAANHISPLDTFTVIYSMPLKLRIRLAVLMSIEYHFNNFFYHSGSWWRRAIEAVGFYLLVNLFINACPLSRTHGFKQVMENIGKLLSRKWSILIYPEGRVTTDGSIKEFESGIGAIASDMEVSVVPVRIKGLFNILRNGILPWGHIPRWPLVTVSFGKPMKFKGMDYREIAGIIEKEVRTL
ncbi:MAG TPA: AMP-binding protein [Candidatus Hydromicrobium sp.]